MNSYFDHNAGIAPRIHDVFDLARCDVPRRPYRARPEDVVDADGIEVVEGGAAALSHELWQAEQARRDEEQGLQLLPVDTE